MAIKTVRDYYTIQVPGDAFETIEDASSYAVREARDRAKLYCIPCEWQCKLISGEIGDSLVTFKVCRIRRFIPRLRIEDVTSNG